MHAERFFEAVYQDNEQRLGPLKRKFLRDARMYLVNRGLCPIDRFAQGFFQGRSRGLVFIVGAPRSGTTLLSQLMVSFLDVGYVSNKMARYWAAPIFASCLHRPDGLRASDEAWRSQYGRTSGDDQPHEFSWFWHHHLDFRLCDQLRKEELRAVDGASVSRALRGLSGSLGEPLLLKSIRFVNFQIEWLSELMPEAKFVWIERARHELQRSILEARRANYGDERIWWSVRPEGYRQWLDKPPDEQVHWQVWSHEEHFRRVFSRLPAESSLRLQYEALVDDPRHQMQRLSKFIGVNLRQTDRLRLLRLGPRNAVRR